MQTAKVFMNGNSQAVRLPKAFRFENTAEVAISRSGDKIILEPVAARPPKTWKDLFAEMDAAGGAADFPLISELDRLPMQERASLLDLA
jgi:antitoxin VapB